MTGDSLLQHEEWLRQQALAALARDNPALAALLQQAVEAPVLSKRETLADESARLKVYTASQALSDLEQQSEQALMARASVARQQATSDQRWPALQALAADLPDAWRARVYAAYVAGKELATRAAPSLRGRELWPVFPSAVVVDKSGRYLPVVAVGDKHPTEVQVKVQLPDAREELRVVQPAQLLGLRRETPEWRGFVGARLGCEVRCGKPEKTLLVLWDEAKARFEIATPGEAKPDPKVAGCHDPTGRLEREVAQQRLLLKEPERHAWTQLLLSAQSPVERVAVLRSFCINGDGVTALVAARAVLRMLDAISLSAGPSFDRAGWLGAAGLAERYRGLGVIGPYELMWAYANPLVALEWLAGGDDLAKLRHAGLEATTPARLINKELAHQVARSPVRYFEVTGTAEALQSRLDAHLAGQWVEGVLAETRDGAAVVVEARAGAHADSQLVVLTSAGAGLVGSSEVGLRSLLLRASAVAEESDEARAKLEKTLRHALTTNAPKQGVLVGFVRPGGARTSAGVAIEDAELWCATSADIRGNAVTYKLQRFDGSEAWAPRLDELLAGRPTGAKLQFVEMVPKRGK